MELIDENGAETCYPRVYADRFDQVFATPILHHGVYTAGAAGHAATLSTAHAKQAAVFTAFLYRIIL
jgi:hypothetical protein